MSWHFQQKQAISLLERVQIKAEQSTLALVRQLFRSASANPAPKRLGKGILPKKALFCKFLIVVNVSRIFSYHISARPSGDKYSFWKKTKSSVKVHSQGLSPCLLLSASISRLRFFILDLPLLSS